MVEESLEDKLQTMLHSAQSCIRSVVYNVAEKGMLGLLREEVIDDTQEAHIANFLNTIVAGDKLPKRVLTSSSIMAPIARFVRRKT